MSEHELSDEAKERIKRFEEQLTEEQRQEAIEYTSSVPGFKAWVQKNFKDPAIVQFLDMLTLQGPAILHYLTQLIR